MITDEKTAKEWVRALPECDAPAFDRLEQLAELLIEENSRQNLIADATIPQMWQRHIADSAQLLSHVPRETSGVWLDLGTGAGFPGLVVAALRPDMVVRLVESRARRIAWLERVQGILKLSRVEVVGSRLENVPHGEASVISARAFAPLETLLGLAERFSTASTTWVLPKGRSAAQELQGLRGWPHMFHVEPSLTDMNAGIVVGQLAGRKGAKQ